MFKKVTLAAIFLLTINLYAYSDIDMDGVPDNIDKCPNTPLSKLVDKNGCAIENLFYGYHYDYIYGLNYTDTSALVDKNNVNTPSFSLRADLYYKKYYLQTYTSYYVNNDENNNVTSGLYDTYLGIGYKDYIAKSLYMNAGLGVLLPTYHNDSISNNTDIQAQINLSYMLRTMIIFGGASYTVINDKYNGDSDAYQNSDAYSIGVGRYLNAKTYGSISYSIARSIYKHVVNVESATAYVSYTINAHKYVTASYSYGISDSANKNSISILMGQHF